MTWFYLSLLTAISVASQDAWVKKFFSDFNPYEMSVIPMIYSLPVFLPALFFIRIPDIDMTYYICILASLPLNTLSILFYMKAIRRAPLSLTLPYLAFSPIFMLFTEYLLLSERPGKAGVSGVFLICIGAYILNLNKKTTRILDPFRALTREKGAQMMILVAFLFSLAAPVGKIGILHSSPAFFSLSFFPVLTIFLLLVFYKKMSFKNITDSPFKGIGAGFFFICHVLFHAYAVSLINVTYMISIKRFSVLFGILYGRLFFKEKNTLFRLAGGLIMVAGAGVITIFN